MEKDKKRKLKGGPIVIIIISFVILIIVSRNYFSFLDAQLFEERKNYIVEFTEKASEIVDSVIEYSWQQVYACMHIMKNERIESKEDLMDMLLSTYDFVDSNNSLVIAIDKNANYYSSDNKTGRWPQTELLTQNANDKQQIVADVPHKIGLTYFVCIERLEKPIQFSDGSNEITHIAVAADVDIMRGKFSVRGFGDNCYTYLVNKDGRRLYKYTYADNFIEGYNVLGAFHDVKILHGGTYDGFVNSLKNGQNDALEFVYRDEDGKEREWFVANAAITLERWQILLFVPTEILGENSNLLLERTIYFFIIVSILILVLVIIIVLVAMISKSDKRLMKQKDEVNKVLKTAAEEANNANQAKSDFLSHMSHDIRTPINGIMGMTDIALKNIGNDEKIFDCLQKISGSSKHLLGLINDVLDMSRIESGKTKINYESFDIRTCIDNCVSIIGGQLETRTIELVNDMDTFEHPFLIGDELHLRQVFINILGNSVKFTPDGGKIYFRTIEKEVIDGKAKFRFELADTGIGMKKEFIPHLFEAFAQEDDGTRTSYKGTGLGMAITKKFVDMMGGTIEVKSELNVGTEFIIELLIDIDKDAQEKEAKDTANINLEGMHALLVEDIELNLEIAQCILEERGVKVTPAMNGQEAVDTFNDNPEGTFDIIIMDIMMPVMDGITATKTIRALDRPDSRIIPIIAMTANAYEEDMQKTHEAGMNAHLSKPIDTDVLIRTLSGFYDVNNSKKKMLDLSGMKVMLVDDAELNLEVAAAILEEHNMIITTAENGKEAIELFEKNPKGTFDMILMDVNMPVMDGLEATKTIRSMDREDACKIPIIAMTADVYEEDIEKTNKAGMNGHLTKPLDVKKMIEILSDI